MTLIKVWCSFFDAIAYEYIEWANPTVYIKLNNWVEYGSWPCSSSGSKIQLYRVYSEKKLFKTICVKLCEWYVRWLRNSLKVLKRFRLRSWWLRVLPARETSLQGGLRVRFLIIYALVKLLSRMMWMIGIKKSIFKTRSELCMVMCSRIFNLLKISPERMKNIYTESIEKL